ncbi:MAG: sensor histidine kinase, partial [Synechococcaceae cyanobacterium]|nr:sensor histidine kinase [Synechococcaceae cyanobacterium]
MSGTVAALLAAALVAGLALGVGLGRRGAARPRRLADVAPSQLLRWLQEAPGGWLLLDAGDMVRLINPRAERLLQVPGAALLRRPSLLDVCAAPELPAVIATARRRRRPQRFDWQAGDEEVEMHILPGEQGWVAVALQSRRSLEAQLDQQSRWVGDVAHELKTPLTALLLVGDSLAARVNSQNAILVE